ncbi:SusC/RagA family TonB-linked outer membrane protein [Sphingobacterium hungaricum]
METTFYKKIIEISSCRKNFPKILKILFVILLVSVQSYAKSMAQNITLNEKNSKIEDVLLKIRNQANLDLIGNLALLQNAKLVSIQVTKEPLSSVLDKLSTGQNFVLKLKNNTVLVQPRVQSINKSTSEENSSQETYLLKGAIKDSLGRPLAGASIEVVGRKNSTTTSNNDGNFLMNVTSTSVLRIRLLGYSELEYPVDGKRIVSIQLTAQDKEIEDVVVTGYTKVSRESFTGAVTTITRKELEKFNNNNIFSVLQSIDPSFKVDEGVVNGSNPNVIPEINIRGIASVGSYAVNAPLVIMDGFEVSLQTLSDLDVNRIETISILKDASSTILYGSRGGNGVIVIETRLPKEGKMTLSYNAKPSVTVVDLSDYNLMNAEQKLQFEVLAGLYTKSGSSQSDFIEQELLTNLYNDRLKDVQSGVNTYWLSQPVQNTMSVDHTLRIEGGREDIRYSLEGNYNNYKGAIKESARETGGANFNLVYRIPDKFSFRNNASYIYSNAKNSPYGTFSTYTQMNPYERIFDENGDYIKQYNNMGDYAFSREVGNPLYDASLPYLDYLMDNYFANNIEIEYFLNKDLRFIFKGLLSRTFFKQQIYTSPFHSSFINEPNTLLKGTLTNNNGEKTNYSGNVTVQYSKTLRKHSFTAIAIGEILASNEKSSLSSYAGFVDDRFMSASQALSYNILNPIEQSIPERMVSFAANATYAFDNKVYLSGSYRLDGSSKLGSNNKFGGFYSYGVSYNLHREEWFKNNVVTNLRLFANYGTNGNENYTADMASTRYNFFGNEVYLRQYAAVYDAQGNENLRWPKVGQTSGGVDVNFFKNKIAIKAGFYEKITNDMISSITLAPSNGFENNIFFSNIGKVSNKGFEISSNFEVYNNPSKELIWILSLSAVQNRSKLLEISNELEALNESNVVLENGFELTPSEYYQEGESLENIHAVRSLGIDPATGRELYLNYLGNPTFTWDPNDKVIVGNLEPNVYGTFGTTISYKRLSIQAIFNYSIGGDIYNQTLMDKVENNNPYVNADLRVLEDRWQEPGDVAMFKNIADPTITQISSRFVQKENFLRFSILNVNYELPHTLISKFRLQRARLNFSTNDMFRLSTVKMERGTDYPYARTFNFGIAVEL